MMDLLTSAMDAGAALAETFSKPVNTGASFTRYGTVVKNNGATLDVELCGATLAAVPMLTTCAGAQAGDRCLLTVDGPLVTVTGILANADNPHYVKHGIYSLPSMTGQESKTVRINISMPTDDYVVTLTNCSASTCWTKMFFKLSSSGTSKTGFSVDVYNDGTLNQDTCANPRFMWAVFC